tara:strand:- start:1400 stop:2275 length:876 start_codon:yes stop_codon:yes gene_type:complete
MTKEELLTSGGLDFTVSKRKMLYEGIYDRKHDTPFFCTVNDKTGEALGPVRSRYTIMQNSEILDIVLSKLLSGTYDLSKSKCGLFKGGKKIFFFIKLNNEVELPASDAMNLYLYAISSHDGSQRLAFGVTTKMHSCSNMFSLLMSDKDNKHIVKHTSELSQENVSYINGLISRNVKGLTKLFDVMWSNQPEDSFIDLFVNKIFPLDGKRVNETTKERNKLLRDSLKEEMNIKGRNYYGLFNGLTHYYTHHNKDFTNNSNDYELLYGSYNQKVKQSLNLIIEEMKSKNINLN